MRARYPSIDMTLCLVHSHRAGIPRGVVGTNSSRSRAHLPLDGLVFQILRRSIQLSLPSPLASLLMSLARLLTCVLGVYATFLLWAIAQERRQSRPTESLHTSRSLCLPSVRAVPRENASTHARQVALNVIHQCLPIAELVSRSVDIPPHQASE